MVGACGGGGCLAEGVSPPRPRPRPRPRAPEGLNPCVRELGVGNRGMFEVGCIW